MSVSIIKYLIVVAFAQILKPYWMEISIITAVLLAVFFILHLLMVKEIHNEIKTREEKVLQHSDPAD